MGSDGADEVEALFHAVADLADDDAARVLDAECVHAPALREQVERLLFCDRMAPAAFLQPDAALAIGALQAADATGSGRPSRKRLRSILASGFAGTDRFAIRGLLGAGGMGLVFAAVDRDCQCDVALKLLPSLSPMDGVRFKNEFRLASGFHHPNLVTLGELIEDRGFLFFTMELVDGVDWLAHLRGQTQRAPLSWPSELAPTTGSSLCPRHDVSISPATPTPAAPSTHAYGALHEAPACALNEARLRAALEPLVDGLLLLHAAGTVHRDVKPSNVLVTDQGRVVLLDFGLAMDVSRGTGGAEGRLTGTPLYMSPEQARGLAPTPASDWYSVGVLLYEALAGRRPFAGGPASVLASKQSHDPVAPAMLNEAVPEDLNRLCMTLLSRDPSARASGADVLAVLRPSGRYPFEVGRAETSAGVFVGRRSELASLTSAFDAIASEPLAVVVEGESGVGKTALVRRFCEQIESGEPGRRILICRGICSQRESVSFKAMDGVADGLAAQIGGLEDAHAQAAARAATFVFPVLGRAIRPEAGAIERPADPLLQRKLAFQGLRDLLVHLARIRRIVVCIDDWQWVDADSVRLLHHVLAAPGAPPVLLVMTSRTESQLADLPCALRRIQLGNLEPVAARQLANQLLGDVTAGPRTTLAEAVATESLGHPLFIAALARQILAGERFDAGHPDLEGAIGSRVAALPGVARAAAELLAVARGPLSLSVLHSALGAAGHAISWIELSALIGQLARENLARAAGVRGVDSIDCFHARVGGAVLARLLTSERRARHEALARGLEDKGSPDFESMSDHWQEAGRPDRAATYALQAADGAAGLLAFERAARLYRRSLQLSPATPSAVASIQERLAQALAHAGRGREAAQCYLAAAEEAEDRQIDLYALAADQLFRSGYVDDALGLIDRVFPSLGLYFPKSSNAALLRLALRRLWIRCRGVGFRRRPLGALASDAVARVDAAWTVSVGLSTVDNLKGACVQSGSLLLALRTGEPFRVVRALAAEAAYMGTAGTRSRRTVDRLLARATELAGELGDPYALGFVHLARCFALYLRSEFTGARAAGEAAEAVFEQRPMMASWELTSARMLTISSHLYSGDLAVIRRRVPELVREAESRGDRYGATCFRSMGNAAWLVADESDEARRNLRLADESWHYHGVHLQQCWSLAAWVNVDLYEGAAENALERVRRAWPGLIGSFVMRFERLRAELLWLRGRAALAASHQGDRAERLADAKRCGTKLLAESAPWASAAGQVVLAGVLAAHGHAALARERLRTAALRATACDVPMLARVCSDIVGDERAGLAGQVERPDRWARMIAPGLT
jgi:serine/threonine protein kinase